MRRCLAADDLGRGEAVALTLFDAYFGKGLDIADKAVLDHVLRRHDEDGRVASLSLSPGVKTRLSAQSEALVARGGFGVPTSFVGQDMFFGADRLWLAAAALRRSQAR